jgi:hypothetical protein
MPDAYAATGEFKRQLGKLITGTCGDSDRQEKRLRRTNNGEDSKRTPDPALNLFARQNVLLNPQSNTTEYSTYSRVGKFRCARNHP